MARDRVLVVEDESSVRGVLREYLESHGYDVIESRTCNDAEKLWQMTQPDIAIVDYSLPDGNAVALLPRLKVIDPHAPIIVLTGFGSIDLAAEAIKLGADQFLTKPAELATLTLIVQRSLENHRNRKRQLAENGRLLRRVIDPFVGVSPAIQSLSEIAKKTCVTDQSVLIQGETGSGKGILATWLHQNGPRACHPFVDLNCGGVSPELLEDELFGHEGGALAGNVASKPGLLEIGHKGTLFLDEIGEAGLPVQLKLQKVLEEKQFRRMGDVFDRRMDIRTIVATRHDLPRLVQNKQFRGELYLLLSTVTLTVPPLRQRTEDIPVLAFQILGGLSAELGLGPVQLSTDAIAALQSHSWPGNIRELRNVLERAVLLSGNRLLTAKDLRFDLSPLSNDASLAGVKTLEQVERQHIEDVLSMEHGRVEAAARKLGIPRSSLYNKIKQYRIPRQSANAPVQ